MKRIIIKKKTIEIKIIEIFLYTSIYFLMTGYDKYLEFKKNYRLFCIVNNINNKNGIPREIVEYIISYT